MNRQGFAWNSDANGHGPHALARRMENGVGDGGGDGDDRGFTCARRGQIGPGQKLDVEFRDIGKTSSERRFKAVIARDRQSVQEARTVNC